MVAKYVCPKCGRRFVDWGAEKLQFRCPTAECARAELVLLGSGNLDLEDKPKLKRSRKRSITASLGGEIGGDMEDEFMGGAEEMEELEVGEEGEEFEEEATEELAVDSKIVEADVESEGLDVEDVVIAPELEGELGYEAEDVELDEE